MALALAYPILAITIQWLCGHTIDFGGQEVIAASPPQARIFTAVWLGSTFLVYLFAATSKPRWRWPLLWRSLLFMFTTWILGLGSIYADGFAVPRNVAVAEERSSRPMVWRLSYCGVLVAFLIMAIKMPDDFGASQRNQAVFLIVSLGLLPLFNALFDFLSAGLTRYLLRLGIDEKRAVWRAILDGLGGIAIFFAL